MAFKAVAFDVDGTLYPSASLYLRAVPLALRSLRVTSAFRSTRAELRSLAAGGEYRPARPGTATLHALQASIMARRMGIPVEEAAALVRQRFYHEVAGLFGGLAPFPGLVPALDRLAAGGLRLAVLSDFPPERKLESMGLGGRFEAALCSEDSGYLKPAPEPFLMAAATLGLPPGQVLYVGNSAAYDLAGARAAGMACAVLTLRRLPGAALCFRDWDKLASFALAKA